MKFTDGKRTVEIRMYGINGAEWSNDFFNGGHGCEYDEEKEAYIVNDVDYCIEAAEDCVNHRGDYYDEIEPSEDEHVEIIEIEG